MEFQKKRAQVAGWLETVYLFLFGLLVGYLFLRITTFEIPWDFFFKNESGGNNILAKMLVEVPYYLFGLVAFLRYTIQEKYDYKKILIAFGVFLLGRYIWQESGRSRVLLFLLLMLGAKDISFQRIIKIFFTVISSLLALTVVCAVGGVIENYTYELVRGVRRSFGIIYPTNFAAIVFFQVLCWWYLRKEKTTYWEAAGVAGIAAFLKIYCDARCSSLSLMGVALIMCWQRFQYQRCGRLEKEYEMNGILSSLLPLSVLLASAGSIITTILYGAIPVLHKLDLLLSTRLFLGKKALNVYGMSLWGQYIRLFSNAEGRDTTFYFYIDSSYLQLAVIYGLVTFGMVLLAFLLIGCRAKTQRDWTLLWILAFIAVHGIVEQHLVELPYCPFILALFADTGEQKGLELRRIFGRKNG